MSTEMSDRAGRQQRESNEIERDKRPFEGATPMRDQILKVADELFASRDALNSCLVRYHHC